MPFEPLQSPYWNQGRLEEVIPNTIAPLDTQDLKDFLKITTSDEDAELSRALLEATRMVQFEIGRAITTWSLRLHIDAFPAVIDLPYPPLQGSVTSIVYVDANGTDQTLAASEYQVQSLRDRILIVPVYGKTWPATRTQYSAVRVAYLAGVAAAANVLPDVKLAIKWKVKLLREDQLTGTIARELRDGYERIIGSLRRVA